MKKTVISLAIALMLLVSFSVAASAEAPPAESEHTYIVQLDDMTAPGQTQESEAPGAQGKSSAQPGQEKAADNEAGTETEAPAPEKSNTPYFIGASIAVLVFLGVAFYCKTNGNKTL